MNPELVGTFTEVAAGLMTSFGRPVTHTNASGDEVLIQAVIESALEAVGEFGERMEPRTTAQVAKTTGAAVGDTFTHAGGTTLDDPYPDDVVWTAAQLLADDGFVLTFAVRSK